MIIFKKVKKVNKIRGKVRTKTEEFFWDDGNDDMMDFDDMINFDGH